MTWAIWVCNFPHLVILDRLLKPRISDFIYKMDEQCPPHGPFRGFNELMNRSLSTGPGALYYFSKCVHGFVCFPGAMCRHVFKLFGATGRGMFPTA